MPVGDDLKPIAQALHATKRYSGLAYMSSRSEVTSIATEFPDVDFGAFLIKAAQKSFMKVFDEETLSVVKVDSLTD